MKAGIDFGTSLVKAVWMHGEGYKFVSTADGPLDEIVQQMKNDQVRELHIAGIGYSKDSYEQFGEFELRVKEGDPIENEVMLQSGGAKRLLEIEGYPLPQFLLVSMGTGTSYTLVTKEKATKFPLGNSLSGGLIQGLGKVLGAANYEEIARLAACGTPLDLLIKDMIPEKAGTFEGELVVANFAKGSVDSEKKDAYATIMSLVAVATIRDVMLVGMMPNFQVPEEVVFIGSTISRTPTLKNLLEMYSTMIGKKPYFPVHGEFSLAMGAYQMGSAMPLK